MVLEKEMKKLVNCSNQEKYVDKIINKALKLEKFSGRRRSKMTKRIR